MTPPTRHTEQPTPGPATASHVEAFVESDHARFMGGPAGPDASREDAWISVAAHAGRRTPRGHGAFWVSETARGLPVGRGGVRHPDWLAEPELSWVACEAHARRGDAVEAARAWAAARGLPPLVGLVLPGNAASEAVARRLGARRAEGPHGSRSGEVTTVWRHPPGDAA